MFTLGRRVEHDPQSWGFPARRAVRLRTVLWPHHAPILDQSDLGSCEGNSLAQLLNTTKFVKSRPRGRYLDENAARSLYSEATALDNFPGQWPTEDTGTSGLAVCKAGVNQGYLTRYDHAFGIDHTTAALQLQPLITGINWYNDMFEPDSKGFLHPIGGLAGGHALTLLGVNLRWEYYTILNHWYNQDGTPWGANGRAKINRADYTRLLDEQGDVTVPIGK